MLNLGLTAYVPTDEAIFISYMPTHVIDLSDRVYQKLKPAYQQYIGVGVFCKR
jgi:hypothetical protein